MIWRHTQDLDENVNDKSNLKRYKSTILDKLTNFQKNQKKNHFSTKNQQSSSLLQLSFCWKNNNYFLH